MQVKATGKTRFIFQRNVYYTSLSREGQGTPTLMIRNGQFYFAAALQLWDLVSFTLSEKKSFLSTIRQWDWLMTFALSFDLKVYLFILPPLTLWVSSETALDLRNSLIDIAAVLRKSLFQQSSIVPRNVYVLNVPRTALLSIISYINQLESLHLPALHFALTIICSK